MQALLCIHKGRCGRRAADAIGWQRKLMLASVWQAARCREHTVSMRGTDSLDGRMQGKGCSKWVRNVEREQDAVHDGGLSLSTHPAPTQHTRHTRQGHSLLSQGSVYKLKYNVPCVPGACQYPVTLCSTSLTGGPKAA